MRLLASTVLPSDAVSTSLGSNPQPSIMFSHAAMMKCTCQDRAMWHHYRVGIAGRFVLRRPTSSGQHTWTPCGLRAATARAAPKTAAAPPISYSIAETVRTACLVALLMSWPVRVLAGPDHTTDLLHFLNVAVDLQVVASAVKGQTCRTRRPSLAVTASWSSKPCSQMVTAC